MHYLSYDGFILLKDVIFFCNDSGDVTPRHSDVPERICEENIASVCTKLESCKVVHLGIEGSIGARIDICDNWPFQSTLYFLCYIFCLMLHDLDTCLLHDWI